MKRILTIFPIGILIVSACLGCGNGADHAAARYYEEAVLDQMKTGIGVPDRMTGMADGLVLAEDSRFDPNYVTASAAGLFSEDEQMLLYGKHLTDRMYPASMTKVMTAFLVLEQVADLEDEVLITDAAYQNLSSDSSTANLKVGGKYSVKDLLYALLLPSANEAANGLAIHVSGSVEAFVKKMNDRAKELGMMNTHFMNPHGLHDANHYTTVYDLYLLFRQAVSIPVFLEIAGSQSAEITCRMNGNAESSFVSTSNSFIRKYTAPPHGIVPVAGKTGYTTAAGRCLVMLFTDSKGYRYISVIAHADTYDGVYEETVRLLELIH